MYKGGYLILDLHGINIDDSEEAVIGLTEAEIKDIYKRCKIAWKNGKPVIIRNYRLNDRNFISVNAQVYFNASSSGDFINIAFISPVGLGVYSIQILENGNVNISLADLN